MIVVKLELWPFGDESKARPLGTAIIANDGSGSNGTGNYRVVLSKRGKKAGKWKEGALEGFPRKRLGAWDLLYRALDVVVGDRNK